MTKKFWRIAGAVVVVLLIVGGATAYHERHLIRRYLLVHQSYAKKDVLRTGQIKLNLRPALSTKNTTATNKLTASYQKALKALPTGKSHAKVVSTRTRPHPSPA